MNKVKEQLPCKFGQHYEDWVPMPFGVGNCPMPGFECTYDGDIIIPEDMTCEENNNCPAYKPIDTVICKKHVPNTRYYDVCPTCMEKADKAHAEAEADREYWAKKRRE